MNKEKLEELKRLAGEAQAYEAVMWSKANQAFYKAARTAVPELIAEVERLGMEKESLSAALSATVDEASRLEALCKTLQSGTNLQGIETAKAIARAEKAEARVRELETLLDEKVRCDCSDHDACQFARDRDANLARAEKAEARVRELEGKVERVKRWCKEWGKPGDPAHKAYSVLDAVSDVAACIAYPPESEESDE